MGTEGQQEGVSASFEVGESISKFGFFDAWR
jgi:hypothetical protein